MNDQDNQILINALDTHTSAIYALVEAMGMRAENDIRKQKGETIAYGEDSFAYILAKHNLQGF